MLETLGIDLNIPPFLDGRQQLPYEEIEAGRTIASLRIHVERAIGRIKTYKILKSTIPLSMARLIAARMWQYLGLLVLTLSFSNLPDAQ